MKKYLMLFTSLLSFFQVSFSLPDKQQNEKLQLILIDLEALWKDMVCEFDTETGRASQSITSKLFGPGFEQTRSCLLCPAMNGLIKAQEPASVQGCSPTERKRRIEKSKEEYNRLLAFYFESSSTKVRDFETSYGFMYLLGEVKSPSDINDSQKYCEKFAEIVSRLNNVFNFRVLEQVESCNDLFATEKYIRQHLRSCEIDSMRKMNYYLNFILPTIYLLRGLIKDDENLPNKSFCDNVLMLNKSYIVVEPEIENQKECMKWYLKELYSEFKNKYENVKDFIERLYGLKYIGGHQRDILLKIYANSIINLS